MGDVRPTLLMGAPGANWRPWFEANGAERVAVLDPAAYEWGFLGQVVQLHHGAVENVQFVGGIVPSKCAPDYFGAVQRLFAKCPPPTVVQLPAFRPTPAHIAVLTQLVQAFQVGRIVIDVDVDHVGMRWPVEAELVELPRKATAEVQNSLRRAQWLRFFQRCQPQDFALPAIQFLGSRLGSGSTLTQEDRSAIGLFGPLHAEVCGAMLLLVCEDGIDDHDLARALDRTHTHQAQIVQPSSFDSLLCDLLDHEWQSLGSGIIESIDFAEGRIGVLAQSMPPAPCAAIRLGSLRVDRSGIEIGEVRFSSL